MRRIRTADRAQLAAAHESSLTVGAEVVVVSLGISGRAIGHTTCEPHRFSSILMTAVMVFHAGDAMVAAITV